MPARKVRGIVFDIGRVLVRVDVGRAMDGLASVGSLSAAEVWSAIQNDPRWTDWQEGRVTPSDWHLHLSQKLGGKLSFKQFTEVWNRALDPEPILERAFLEKLAKRYRLAAISNTDPIHVEHLEASYPFLSLFAARIYSCKAGVSKPDPLIYRQALSACKLRAEEAIYVDDVPAYAEAAGRLGMQSMVFHSPEHLKSDLHELGVSIA